MQMEILIKYINSLITSDFFTLDLIQKAKKRCNSFKKKLQNIFKL